MPKQQFKSENKSVYKDFEINIGKLPNGEQCYEAWSEQRQLGFFRKTTDEIYGAIDFYNSTASEFIKEINIAQ